MEEPKAKTVSPAERIAQLEAQLAAEKARNADLEDSTAKALAQAQATAMQSSSVTEVFAGVDDKTGEDTYFYKIDLPPSGGLYVSINGVHYYHGETYRFRVDTLRSLKEIIARSWGHENSINGSNENAYRKPMERVLRGRA